MELKSQFKSIRSFIGAKDFEESSNFYKDLGFLETVLSTNMSVFKVDEKLSFYLQKAYVKDWVDNSMLFLEVDNLENYLTALKSKELTKKYFNVKLSEIVVNKWGKEFFLHDPSGVLWHIGSFY
ncbi:VOC family protein [Polaribacter aquimarinus]|uniref:Glyoxalase n=1 Tax=Polaribacter aquimarinus TaxID=2100726 RepID=A0A2U2J7I0_9FLAO|nr:glyoxalase [Polaribacter aquimarinus]PWG04296.1 glyoxalase [Polaribacter aquimarinus]